MQLTQGAHKHGWWLPDGTAGQLGGEARAGRGGSAGAAEADAVMQLAVKQRMNTDSRRAIFCILMSADDYVRFFIAFLRHLLCRVWACWSREQWLEVHARISLSAMGFFCLWLMDFSICGSGFHAGS